MQAKLSSFDIFVNNACCKDLNVILYVSHILFITKNIHYRYLNKPVGIRSLFKGTQESALICTTWSITSSSS